VKAPVRLDEAASGEERQPNEVRGAYHFADLISMCDKKVITSKVVSTNRNRHSTTHPPQ